MIKREVLEIDAWNGSAVVTLRFTISPSFTTGPADTPPNTVIPDGVKDPGLIKFTMFDGNKTSGQSSYAYGEAVLHNNDRSLDYLKTYSFDGREMRLFEGPVGAAYPAGFDRVYTAIIAAPPAFSWDTVSFSLRNKQANLDVKVPAGTFLGNNTAPAGVEGGTDLTGQDKPFLLGRALGLTPVCCNNSKLIYAVSPATGASVLYMGSAFAVYDSGLALKYEGTYSSQADMEANAPSPGCYRVWEQGGYFRLGTKAAGAVTCDAVQYGRATTAKIGNLMKDLLTLLGVSYDSASIDQLNTDFVAEVGFYGRGILVSDCLDQLAASAGAYWYFTPAGVFKVGRLVDPSSLTADYTLSTQGTAIHSAQVSKPQDTPNGLPAHTVTLLYGRNYTPLTDGLAISVTQDRKEWLKNAWRKVQVVASSTKTAHPLSEEMVITTTLTQANTAEATRRASLYSVSRDLLELELSMDAFGVLSNLRPGLCAAINLKDATQGSLLYRFNYINKKMILVSYSVNRLADKGNGRIKAVFWG